VVDGRWLPSEILLIVEIVSPGSVELDRYLKPVECTQAGVRHFWRVERDGPPTVHMFGLGVGSDGAPTYAPRTVALLEDLLVGSVPDLEP